MNGLEQLDRLRREAVERARRTVLEARATLQQAECALQEALQLERTAERRLTQARADFAAAGCVLGLRAAELQLTHARSVRTARRDVTCRCERTHSAARATLAEQERALLEAELGRRAVERRLARQVVDVGRRTERQREDEAEDAFRATRAR